MNYLFEREISIWDASHRITDHYVSPYPLYTLYSVHCTHTGHHIKCEIWERMKWKRRSTIGMIHNYSMLDVVACKHMQHNVAYLWIESKWCIYIFIIFNNNIITFIPVNILFEIDHNKWMPGIMSSKRATDTFSFFFISVVWVNVRRWNTSVCIVCITCQFQYNLVEQWILASVKVCSTCNSIVVWIDSSGSPFLARYKTIMHF